MTLSSEQKRHSATGSTSQLGPSELARKGLEAGARNLSGLPHKIRASPDAAMQGSLSELAGIVMREQEVEDSARRGNIALKTIGVVTRSRVMFKRSVRALTAAGVRG